MYVCGKKMIVMLYWVRSEKELRYFLETLIVRKHYLVLKT